MIHVIAIITTQPGKRGAVLATVHANRPAVLAEAGCLEYAPAVDAQDGPASQACLGPDTLVIVEKWTDLAALAAHAAAPHMLAYGAKVKEMVASRAIHILSPA